MALIYNPQFGKPIPSFVFENNKYNKIDDEGLALKVGEVGQFPDAVTKFMVLNWGFLEEVTPQRALEIKQEGEKIKCSYCEFTFKEQAALEGHLKKHPEAAVKTEEIIPDIPMAQATPIEARINTQEATQDVDDMKGPDWYGAGLTETRGTL